MEIKSAVFTMGTERGTVPKLPFAVGETIMNTVRGRISTSFFVGNYFKYNLTITPTRNSMLCALTVPTDWAKNFANLIITADGVTIGNEIGSRESESQILARQTYYAPTPFVAVATYGNNTYFNDTILRASHDGMLSGDFEGLNGLICSAFLTQTSNIVVVTTNMVDGLTRTFSDGARTIPGSYFAYNTHVLD